VNIYIGWYRQAGDDGSDVEVWALTPEVAYAALRREIARWRAERELPAGPALPAPGPADLAALDPAPAGFSWIAEWSDGFDHIGYGSLGVFCGPVEEG
jgi:hypothetical protein